MLCQNCGKNEANVHYTQIINGVKKEIALCSQCARELGIDNIGMPDFAMSLHSMLGDFFNDYAENSLLPDYMNESLKCKNCGMTYDDFINTGMFGCEDCYDTFSNPIDSLLKNLHGTAKHIGRGLKGDNLKNKNIKSNEKSENTNSDDKNPKNSKEDKEKELKKKLEKAIKEERYEDAAKIRDELKEMSK